MLRDNLSVVVGFRTVKTIQNTWFQQNFCDMGCTAKHYVRTCRADAFKAMQKISQNVKAFESKRQTEYNCEFL